jgi:hypothetical protein
VARKKNKTQVAIDTAKQWFKERKERTQWLKERKERTVAEDEEPIYPYYCGGARLTRGQLRLILNAAQRWENL